MLRSLFFLSFKSFNALAPLCYVYDILCLLDHFPVSGFLASLWSVVAIKVPFFFCWSFCCVSSVAWHCFQLFSLLFFGLCGGFDPFLVILKRIFSLLFMVLLSFTAAVTAEASCLWVLAISPILVNTVFMKFRIDIHCESRIKGFEFGGHRSTVKVTVSCVFQPELKISQANHFTHSVIIR